MRVRVGLTFLEGQQEDIARAADERRQRRGIMSDAREDSMFSLSLCFCLVGFNCLGEQ